MDTLIDLFVLSIVFPAVLYATLLQQTCDPFSGHDPPVKHRCVNS